MSMPMPQNVVDSRMRLTQPIRRPKTISSHMVSGYRFLLCQRNLRGSLIDGPIEIFDQMLAWRVEAPLNKAIAPLNGQSCHIRYPSIMTTINREDAFFLFCF